MGIFTKKKILIVEDEASLRNAITDTLREHGYDVCETASGSQVVAETQLCQPDLIIIDIMLPGGSGIEALKILRGQDMHVLAPVIVLTNANITSSMHDEIVALDAEYFDKSVTPLADVLETVHQLLSKNN